MTSIKNVFIDSNIWLSLYDRSKNDLEQFKKIKDYLENHNIKLIVPQQVYDEALRNRDNKLNQTLNKFKLQNVEYPAFCKGYEDYNSIKRNIDNVSKEFEIWKKDIENDLINYELPADLAIKEILEYVDVIDCSEYYNKGFIRSISGNPPGKKDSFGDAIIWECLLDVIPIGEDLYFISDDNDFVRPMNKFKMSYFLNKEWESKKKSKIHFFKDLVSFTKGHLKDIELKDEENKLFYIEQLADSSTFIDTHNIISYLSQYKDWSNEQIDRLCTIGILNTQVNWILSDTDLKEFYESIVKDIDKESATQSQLAIYEFFYGN